MVYADRFRTTETADNGDEILREIPFLKGYTVFNGEQIDGLPDALPQRPSPPLPAPARIEVAETFVAATGAGIHHGGNRACYAIDADRVQLPPFESFADPESYYATLLHELTHWTRYPSRLDRTFGRKRRGDEGYAAEALVAELGAVFLCTHLAITPEPRADHASYIASWLAVLKKDKRAIFTSAAHAQRVADFLHGLQLSAKCAEAA